MSTSLAREMGAEALLLPPDQLRNVRRTVDRLHPGVAAVPTNQEHYDLNEHLAKVQSAKDAGMHIIVGDPHSLLLDLDNGAILNEVVLDMLCSLVNEVPMRASWVSRSGVGRHIHLHFPTTKFGEGEAIALEVALGSDPKRAALSVMQRQKGVEQTRFLFMPATEETADLRLFPVKKAVWKGVQHPMRLWEGMVTK